MSDRIGFLVVSQKTGFLLEGKEHATKIFDNRRAAQSACNPVGGQVPVPLLYYDMVQALLSGTVFCFVTEDGHSRFLKALRCDPSNAAFLDYSQDRELIRWRHVATKPA